jgi:hypothetical protein
MKIFISRNELNLVGDPKVGSEFLPMPRDKDQRVVARDRCLAFFVIQSVVQESSVECCRRKPTSCRGSSFRGDDREFALLPPRSLHLRCSMAVVWAERSEIQRKSLVDPFRGLSVPDGHLQLFFGKCNLEW